ncbi:MAG TPA: EutN/CcmL family microcompartment protein [Candidatus Saccharimonadales bacterium]|nr:EutN/CcmL family microcompartment protein [Candidatus Saccharimonadales bacterium]
MNLATVIGTLVATQKVPSLSGQRLLIIEPCDAQGAAVGRPLVAVDLVSAAPGQLCFFVRAREAAHALPGKEHAVDAAIVGLVDEVRRTE